MAHEGALRVAIVGCGFQGRLHAECLGRLPDVEVVAVCDTAEERAVALAQELGIARTYIDYREVLAREDVHVVTVCTMPNTHREIAVAAIEKGCHVLCEKPMALDATEAAAIVAAAEARGVEVGIGFNMRFTESAKVIREHLELGVIGRPICARGHMLADDVPWWGRHYDRSLSGGGALAATAVHMLDLVWWLVGRPRPLTASGSAATLFPGKRGVGAPNDEARKSYSVEDVMFGHVRFEGGFWMSIEGAWVWDQPGWNYGFDLVGSRAQARFDPLEVRGEVDGTLTDIHGPRAAVNDFPGSVAAELEAFVESIRTGEPGGVASARDGLVVQSIVDALYASARKGREVDVA